MVWGLAEVYARHVATAWLRLAAIRTRCDTGVLWPGVFALVGVLLGCGFTLLVASVTERWRTRRQFQRYMLDRRYALYQQTLAAIDDLLYMRDDHADFGQAARTLTAAIVELELLAPPEIVELADQCATLVLRRPGNPVDVAHARARLAAAARHDLATVPRPRGSMPRTTGRHARHSSRSADLPDRGIMGSVSPGLR
jgi:hypothetical protein